jgi:hypothetical protein
MKDAKGPNGANHSDQVVVRELGISREDLRSDLLRRL